MPSALKPKSAPKQLSTKFYADMLNLEIKIQAHDYTFKNIDELVQLYAQAVEYYDYMKDAIKSYFMEKIQIVLASKESLRLIIEKQKEKEEHQKSPKNDDDLLLHQTQEAHGSRQTNKQGKYFGSLTMIDEHKPTVNRHDIAKTEESSDDDDDDEIDDNEADERTEKIKLRAQAGRRQSHRERNHTQRYSISRKRLERSKDFSFLMKIESLKNDESLDPTTILDDYAMMMNKCDKIVKNNLDDQLKKLRERISQKKMQSFYQTTTIKDRSFMDYIERNSERKWDSILQDLADDDESPKEGQPRFLTARKKLNKLFYSPNAEDSDKDKRFLLPPSPIQYVSENSKKSPENSSIG